MVSSTGEWKSARVYVLDTSRAPDRGRIKSNESLDSSAPEAYQIPRDEHLSKALKYVLKHAGCSTESNAIQHAIHGIATVTRVVKVNSGILERDGTPLAMRRKSGQLSALDIAFVPKKVRPLRVTERVKLYNQPAVESRIREIAAAYGTHRSEINLLLSFVVQLWAGLHKLARDGATFNDDTLNAVFRTETAHEQTTAIQPG